VSGSVLAAAAAIGGSESLAPKLVVNAAMARAASLLLFRNFRREITRHSRSFGTAHPQLHDGFSMQRHSETLQVFLFQDVRR
jgi:hypothetical protein